ncbi:MAG: TonB-dependent receptor plug domain-containing protein [Thermodesulfobacteriota bacterium]
MRAICSFLLLSCLCLAPLAVLAEAPPEPVTLAPVTVTAKRHAADFLSTAASATVLDRQDLERMPGENALEVLEQTPGAVPAAQLPGGVSQGGMNGEIGLRGVRGGELVLLNGLPMLSSPGSGSYDLSMIPKRFIERVEIVRGANAVLYGSQAMTGVINIITRHPQTGQDRASQGGFEGQGGNHERWQGGAWLDHPQVWLGLQAESQGRLDGVKRNYSSRSPYDTDLDRTQGQAALLAARPNDWLGLNYMLGRQDSGYLRRYLRSPASDYQTDQELIHHYLWAGLNRDELRGQVFFHQSQMDLTYDYAAMNKPDANDDKRNQTLGLDGQDRRRLGPVDLLYGLRYVFERQDETSEKVAASGRGYTVGRDYARHHRHQASLFAMAEWEFAPKWLFSLGCRGEGAFNAEQGSDDRQELLPQASLLHRLAPGQSLYLNAGRTFRLPTFNQLYSSSDMFGGNPALAPEYGWTYELGFKSAGVHHSAHLGLFHMAYTDKIRYLYDNAQARYLARNVDNWESTGVEAGLRLALGHGFWAGLGGYWADPWEKEDGEKLQSGPKLQAVPELWWQGRGLSLSLGAALQLEREKGLADYTNLRLKASYQVTSNCKLTFSADNLLDKELVIYGNMTPDASSPYEVLHPGLLVWLGAQLSF